MKTGDRMNALLEDLGLSRNAFAQSIGMTSTAINGIVNNTNQPGHKVIMGIKKTYPQYNVEWLMTGEGEMKSTIAPIPAGKNVPADYLQEYLEKLEAQFERLLIQLEVKDRQIDTKDKQLEVKDQQMMKLMDLLGKLDLSESSHCGEERQMYFTPAA